MRDTYTNRYMTISVGNHPEPRIEWPAIGAQGVVVDDGVVAAIERYWASAGWDPSRLSTGGIFIDAPSLLEWSEQVQVQTSDATLPPIVDSSGPILL